MTISTICEVLKSTPRAGTNKETGRDWHCLEVEFLFGQEREYAKGTLWPDFKRDGYIPSVENGKVYEMEYSVSPNPRDQNRLSVRIVDFKEI